MTFTVDHLLAAARRRIRRLDPQEAARAHARLCNRGTARETSRNAAPQAMTPSQAA